MSGGSQPVDELRVALALVVAGLVLIDRRATGWALLYFGVALYLRSLLASDNGGPGGRGGGWWWGPVGPKGHPDAGAALRRLAGAVSRN